jgi:GNAT superfamily N-acetyltransferase
MCPSTNKMITIRQAIAADIPAMHRVRLAVRENRLSTSAITEAHYLSAITETGQGWVAEVDGAVEGFAVGNKATGNVWALFVDPAHEGLGLGKRLHADMVDWLFAQGLACLNLGTQPGTRAQRFYVAAGWTFAGMDAAGEASYELHAP